MTINDKVEYLREQLGPNITAFIVDDANDIGLIAAYDATKIIVDVYDKEAARLWMFGTNPLFKGEAPISMIRLPTVSREEIVTAARAFVE